MKGKNIMSDFSKFSKAVEKQFLEMSKQDMLFKVDVESDLMYQTYLDSFPKGTNDIYRERAYHDCSTCRQFIKNIGKVVALIDNKVVTVWDVVPNEYPYDEVAVKMSEFVSKQRISAPFYTKEKKYGNEFNLELLENDTTKRWNHFVGNIDNKHLSNNPDQIIGNYVTSFKVLKRGLEELTYSSLEVISDMIDDKVLYRGEEHKDLVNNFFNLKKEYDNYKSNDKDLFIWQNINRGNLARFRNTVIGTLAVDISAGEDLETAVKKFESKVAPSNYKRPKAIITKKMINDAMKTIDELNLKDALSRRLATFSDVSINDVLYVDNSVKSELIGGNLHEELLKEAKPEKVKVKNVIDITIDEFLNNVIPKAEKIEAFVSNNHLNNFSSITAPVNENVKNLFKWDNNFAWSYDGNVADSDIKSRVKRAGGNVDAEMRCSLAWSNSDDLDIHCHTPGGNHIYYSNKSGILDVDMNAGGRVNSKDPVENMCWSKNNLTNGKYVISVNNYSRRNSTNVGFSLEFEFKGQLKTYRYEKGLGNNETVKCLEIDVQGDNVTVKTLNKTLIGSDVSQEKWGINTQNFVDIKSIVLSPNHWNDNKVGNKHWFFILDGCKTTEKIRGIYNEFLSSELDKHRKVFEIIGDKTKCDPSNDQMSGLGFSSTQNKELTVRVKSDKIQQVYNVKF